MHAEMEACASAFRFCFGRASGDFSGHLGIRQTLIRLLLQSSVCEPTPESDSVLHATSSTCGVQFTRYTAQDLARRFLMIGWGAI